MPQFYALKSSARRKAEQHPAGNHRDEERRNRKSPRRERPLAHWSRRIETSSVGEIGAIL